jgi:signal peptidase I
MKRIVVWTPMALIVAALVARLFLFDWIHVNGPDMLPTLVSGETYLVSTLSKDPVRGALIAFEPPGVKGAVSVRRVIGMPGDKIEYRGQNVYVNGTPPDEAAKGSFQMDVGPLGRVLERYQETLAGASHPYLIARDPQRHSKDQAVVVVPAGAYYVLADNRNHGRDSREYGVVPAAQVRGTVIRHVASFVRYEVVE